MKRACFFLLLASGVAHADDKADARAAYERGTAAYKKKDYGAAAAEYARADTLAPNPVALQAALDASVQADDPVLGSELLERALARRAEGPLAKSIEAARAKFSERAGRITVVCMDCSATLDGASITTGTPHWARAGSHAVLITRGNSVETKTVDLMGGASIDVSPTPPTATPTPTPTPTPTTTVEPAPTVVTQPANPPPPNPAPDQPKQGGISPVFFFVGLGVTAGLGIASIAVGADTAAQHDAFVKAGCERMDTPDCHKRSQNGSSEQIAANVLIGGTVAFMAATIVSLYFVRWKSAPVQPTATVLPGGAFAGVRASF